MNPPFQATQWLARDREDEMRSVANQEHYYARRPERQPGLLVQLAVFLRGLTNRPEPYYEECDARCAEAA